MSNSTTVTPYSADSTFADMAGLASVCVTQAISLAKWLATDPEECRAAREQFHRQRNSEYAQGGIPFSARGLTSPPPLVSVPLSVKNAQRLAQSAIGLGYRHTATITDPKRSNQSSFILLDAADGRRITIEQNVSKAVIIHTCGDQAKIQQIVRQYTIERAIEHLRCRGLEVRIASTRSGEVRIRAVEKSLIPRRGGNAEVTAVIDHEGLSQLDVANIRGKRCEEIVRGYADATGCRISDTKRKESFSQVAPGESAREEVGL